MAVDKNIIIGVGVDASGVNKGMATASAAIKGATDKIQQGLKPALDGLNTSTKQATEKFSSLRQQIRNATNDAARLTEKYGATHAATKEAVKQVGLLKDKQEKLNEAIAASHPDAKFVVLKNAVQGAANAFAGIQGAMALFGEKNKDVQEALLKVQGAMAFAQGIAAIEQLEIAFKGLYAVIMLNPIAAMAVGIAAAGAAIAYALGAFDGIKRVASNYEKAQSVIVAANKTAEESAAKEVASVRTLIDVAKNEANSKQLRVDAIKKLNEISPQYAENLNTENINTKEGIELTDKLTDAVWKNAKAKAYASEIEKQYSIIIQEQAKLDKAAADAKKFGVKPMIDPETGKQVSVVGNYADKAKKETENAIAVAKESIKYFEGEITAFSKEHNIDIFGTKDDKKAPTKKYDSGPIDRMADDLKIKTGGISSYLEGWNGEIEPLTTIEFKVKDTQYVENKIKAMTERMATAIKSVNAALESAIESSLESVGSLVGNLLSGQADAGTTFLDNILSITAGFLDTFGKALIAAAVASEAFSKLIVNPIAAAAAGIALIATAAIVRNTMQKGLSGSGGSETSSGGGSVGTLKFAEGGIVGGAMYSGDRVNAMVNSGEMILNARQQNNLFNMIKSGVSGSGGGGVLSHRISGNDLLIIMDRASKTRGRTI